VKACSQQHPAAPPEERGNPKLGVRYNEPIIGRYRSPPGTSAQPTIAGFPPLTTTRARGACGAEHSGAMNSSMRAAAAQYKSALPNLTHQQARLARMWKANRPLALAGGQGGRVPGFRC
jgi:hypothetical protein